MIKQPRIYSCKEWGAAAPRHSSALTTPPHVIVHHMATVNRAPLVNALVALEKAKDIAQRCQAGHFANGWADTGQHFTVTIDGVILEGRHGSLDAAKLGRCVRGAHAADSDTGADDNDSFGIECEGTYSTAEMPKAQWVALVALCAWLVDRARLTSSDVIGHRDTGCRTECPGNALYTRLPALRKAVHDALASDRAPK